MKLRRPIRPPWSASADFTALGENSLDTVVAVAGPAVAGKQTALELRELPGGQAATAAVAMARLNWRSRYIGAVGDDLTGSVVRRTLDHERVQPAVVTRAGIRTRRAIVMVNSETGERHVVEHRDPALDFRPDDLPEGLFADTRILLVDLTDPAASLRAARLARAAGARILIDMDRPDPSVDQLLPLVDLIVVPAEALGAISGSTEPGQGVKRLADQSGSGAVIATLGPEGALAWAEGREIRSPAHQVEVVDTTGAGDAFRAGLAAGWLGRHGSDPDLAELLADANLVAALNCRALGAQTSLPQALEVPAHLRGPV
ncbi:MAG TPA: carbohydrate kinase family protein [Vicinamibacterales bacterium]|nr:carbohydrate kinase family protein [Vicinamibacterales bacterium]